MGRTLAPARVRRERRSRGDPVPEPADTPRVMAGTIVLAGACGLVLLETALCFLHLARLTRLSRHPSPDPPSWPRVSVVMAARNEALDIADSVRTRLADDYPELELILVDDRSDDGTGALARQAAAGDPRLRVVRVDELPSGWLGKLHAMHAGAREATGEWLLFSDGDVSQRPGTLRRVVARCVAERLDLLAVLPAFLTGTVLMDAVWTVFMRAMLVLIDPAAVRDPRSRVAMGAGAFNFVRRAALDRIGGLSELRLETGDDVALGMLVKRSGGRVDLVNGSDLVSVPMYRSFRQFLRGVEKNGSSLAHVPVPALVAGFLLLWGLVFSPVAAIAAGPGWLRLLGAVALGAYTAGEVAALWTNSRRWAPALLWPLGGLLLTVGMVRSTWLARRNGGVTWRGTFYSLEELDAGRRLKL